MMATMIEMPQWLAFAMAGMLFLQTLRCWAYQAAANAKKKAERPLYGPSGNRIGKGK